MIVPHIVVDLSAEFRAEAQPFIDKLDREHSGKHSFLDKKGIIRGIYGQRAVWRVWGCVWVDSFHFDLLRYGERFDVKTTHADQPPDHDYWSKVEYHNVNQQCDHLCFVRIHETFERCYIIGTIPKWQFNRDARFFQKGEEDPADTHTPRWVFKESCYAVPCGILAHPEQRYVKL